MIKILGIVGNPNKNGRTNQPVRKALADDTSASGLAFVPLLPLATDPGLFLLKNRSTLV